MRKTVKPLNDVVNEFDSYAELATNVVQSELVKIIPYLQMLRRTTENQVVPSCLKDLRSYALSYMDAIIQTLVSFQATTDSQTLAAGIGEARRMHEQYMSELARLLGVTLEAPTTATPLAASPVVTP